MIGTEGVATWIVETQAILDAIAAECEAVDYKVPGRPETWDKYHEGQFDLADVILSILEGDRK